MIAAAVEHELRDPSVRDLRQVVVDVIGAERIRTQLTGFRALFEQVIDHGDVGLDDGVHVAVPDRLLGYDDVVDEHGIPSDRGSMLAVSIRRVGRASEPFVC